MSESGQAAVETSLAITFHLSGTVFGLNADEVQEVVRVDQITPVHQAPAYVVGIRNLRGRIVTVIDLCARLELGQTSQAPENRILIVNWRDESIGLLVDEVQDTIVAEAGGVAPPPSSLPANQKRFLRGVYQGGGRLISLLDLAPIVGGENHEP